jgi:lipopolysaccharide export system permease protein
MPQLFPISFFLAVVFGFLRLARDRELIILSAAGIGRRFQLQTILRFALVYCILVFGVTLFLAPWAEGNIQRLSEQAKQESDITGITAGQFKEFSKGDRVVYVEGLSGDKMVMENIFLQVRQNDKLGVLTSDRARFKTDEKSGHRFILFEDGRRYVGKPGMQDYQITNYKTYAIRIEKGNIENIAAKLDSVSTLVLLGSDLPMHKAELQWRLSSLIACVLLALLAVLLNQFSLGERLYTPFIIAILIYFIYSNLLGISKTLLKRDAISPFLGLWWVHVLMILVIVFLYYLPRLWRWRNRDAGQQILPAKS